MLPTLTLGEVVAAHRALLATLDGKPIVIGHSMGGLIHRRDATGAWTMRVAIASGRIAAESLGAELIVDAIHRNSSAP